eukprot:4267839-Alexandrium_andersonii.AAC.1
MARLRASGLAPARAHMLIGRSVPGPANSRLVATVARALADAAQLPTPRARVTSPLALVTRRRPRRSQPDRSWKQRGLHGPHHGQGVPGRGLRLRA